MLIMIIFDVDYDYLCHYFCLCASFFSLIYSGTDTPKKKSSKSKKVWSLTVILTGGVCFEKNLSDDNS